MQANSIDYGMEKVDNLVVKPYFSSWFDLMVGRPSGKMKPENSVALSENAFAMDCENTLLLTDSKDLQIVGIDLKIEVLGARCTSC